MLSKLRLAFSAGSSSSASTTTTASDSPPAASSTQASISRRARSTTIPIPGSPPSIPTVRPPHKPTPSSQSLSSSHAQRVPAHTHDPATSNGTSLLSSSVPPSHSLNALLDSPVLDLPVHTPLSPLVSPSIPGSTSTSPSPARSVRRSMTVNVANGGESQQQQQQRDRQESASSSSSSSASASTLLSSTTTTSPSSSSISNYTPTATPRSVNFPTTPFSTPATPPRAARQHTPQQQYYPSMISLHRTQSNTLDSPASGPYITQSAGNSPMCHTLHDSYSSSVSVSPMPVTSNIKRKKTKSTATLPAWIISSFSSSSSSSSSSKTDGNGKEARDAQASRQQASTSSSHLLLPSKMAPAASAFPSRLDIRRGSLPTSSLTVEAAARPRSPSMQMHVHTSQQASSVAHRSSGPSSPATITSPTTPVRIDRPPLKAPSPLSTASSPYQVIDDPLLSSPSTETESSSPARPTRRKSILGKRRNFTEVWNGSSSTARGNDDGKQKGPTLRAGKNTSKGHNRTSSKSGSGSGDYSSLLAASKTVFSKSVDDLTSFTKSSLLSSTSPINYSRPRKSVDERRGGIYSIPSERYAPGLLVGKTRTMMGSEGADVEEELDGLSSGSSVSLAHSPMPSDESTSSMLSMPPTISEVSKPHRSTQATGNHHHIFKVPKLPSMPSSKTLKKGDKAHRKAASSAQVQLPPSVSLPGGLCIESTASILASSMDGEPEVPKIPTSSIGSGTKRKSMDSRSVRSENMLGTSPSGLAPAFTLSPTMPRSAPATSSASSATSSFPRRPPLSSRKSSGGNASVNSSKLNGTARMPSFGSPKASPSIASSPNIQGSAADTTRRQRSSQIILIEGLLQRKTDHRSHVKTSSWTFPFSTSAASVFGSSSSSSGMSPSTSKAAESPLSASTSKARPSPGPRRKSEANIREIDLTKGWKPFYAILRVTNLYLYKLPSDMSWQAKACFSNYSGSSRTVSSSPSSPSLSSSTSRGPTSTFLPSTPLQEPDDLDDDRLKASISTNAKAAYFLPIANSTLRIIHQAGKGDVFELLTEEGEVAILQTASKTEAERWMNMLSSTGLSVANKRASYLEAIGKLDLGESIGPNARQPETIPERNSESHERHAGFLDGTKVFGVPLETLVARDGGNIPAIAEFLFREVEARGLLETGIYRVPGENRVMQAMQAKLNAGGQLDFEANPSFADPHNLASLTKLWLRELPEIIAPAFYTSFIEANNVEGYEERLCAIRELVWRLPATSFHLLDRLCEHLHLVAEHELDNQMHAPNLAIVFAPTILRPPDGSDSYALLMSNLGRAAKLVASLIVQHNWIFSGQEVDEDAGNQEEEVASAQADVVHVQDSGADVASPEGVKIEDDASRASELCADQDVLDKPETKDREC